MIPVIDKLVHKCLPMNQLRKPSNLITNEKFHYFELNHEKKYIAIM